MMDGENLIIPKDKYNLVYFVFLLLGMAMLCSWNSIVSAADYFLKRLPASANMSLYTVAYNVGCVPVMFLATALSARLNYFLVICIPIIINAIMMGVLPIIGTFLSGTAAAQWLIFVICIICGGCTGLINAGGFGLGSVFSSHHTQGIMLGQGIVGLISIVPLILHVSIPGDNTDTVGMIFFCFAAVINVLALIATLLLKVIPYSKWVIQKSSNSTKKLNENQPLILEEANASQIAKGSINSDEKEGSKSVFEQVKAFIKQIIPVAKKKFWWGFAIFDLFFWSLLAFPSIFLAVPSQKGQFEGPFLQSLWRYLKLNIHTFWDFAIRFFTNLRPLYKSCKVMNIISAARSIIVLFLFLCVFVPAFQQTWLVVIVISCFSITNGYHSTVIMSQAGSDLTDDTEKAICGTFMSLCFNIGFFIGCLASMLVSYLIDKR